MTQSNKTHFESIESLHNTNELGIKRLSISGNLRSFITKLKPFSKTLEEFQGHQAE